MDDICRTKFCTFHTTDASVGTVKHLFCAFKGFGIVTPFASQRTAFEKYRRAQAVAVVDLLPITLIAASIVALAFFGFEGVVENLINIGG